MENTLFAKLQYALKDLIKNKSLGEKDVEVTCSVLKPEEAIGKPARNDFAIQKGKEKMLQAGFCGSYGQAFTDMLGGYRGKADDLTELPLETNFERAIFIAGLNAVLRELEMADRTIHCKDEGPENCALELVTMLEKEYGNPKIALFGFQPAMAEKLSGQFPLRIFDLDDDNIGKEKFGILVENGNSAMHGLENGNSAMQEVDSGNSAIREVENANCAIHGLENGNCAMQEVETWADVFLVTGSTLCNGSIVQFLNIQKPVIFFGTTIAGPAALLGLKRFCPESK